MRIRIIDAFTDRPFAGNPAAVCLLDEADTWPDETWMQQVAAEMHLSETAFAHPLTDERRRRLGAALVHARGRDQPVRPRDPGHRARHAPRPRHARDRALHEPQRRARRAHGRRRHHHARLPGRARRARRPRPRACAEALGATPQATYATGALGDLLVVLDDEAAVRSAGARPRRHRRTSPAATASAASSPPRAPPTPRRRLRLRLALLRPRRRHPRGPRHRQRPHGPGAVLVEPPRPRRAHRPAGLGARRPRAHVDPRRPRPPHRPRGRRRSTAR